MIELIDFTKKYSDGNEAVSGINLKAQDGKITGLLGLNGAGKTTIIKAVCGLHYGTNGNCSVLKKDIGYVQEQTNLPEFMTVKEFLYFTYNFYKENTSGFEKDLTETCRLCSLEDVLEKKIHTLSKGFRQRVSFAQAIIHNPKKLILDEPVNGLDPAQIIQFRKMIKEASKNKTVLISTHLMQEVEALCDYVYILSDKKIVAEGTISEIITKTNSKNIEEAFMKITMEKKID